MAVCCLFCFLLLFVCRSSVTAEEEQSFSKFKYDKQMLETMVRVEAKMEQLDKERKTFEENVLSILEHRREEMDDKFKAQREEMEKEFHTQREEMEKKFHTQNRQLETLIDEFNDVRDDVTNTTADMASVAESIKDTPKIAFNAYTMAGGSYPVNKVLVFPNVLLNEGGGYNKITGVFTAPISGLYNFHAHVCHHTGKYMVVSIVHGNKQLATTTEYENSGYSCSSVSAPALVNVRENVFIKSTYSESVMYADSPYRWPSFSGFLVIK